jgi:hypothetical protein
VVVNLGESGQRAAGEWDEAQHPRGEDGKFANAFAHPPASDDPAPGTTFYYHATPVKNLQSVIENGIVPSGRAPISLAPHLDSALFWASALSRGKPTALFRVRRIRVLLLRHDLEDEYDVNDDTAEDATLTPIRPSDLEIYMDGAWKPLAQLRNAEWDERKHLRDEAGKFAPSGTGSGSKKPAGMSTVGMRRPKPEEIVAEAERQFALADAQSDPLAVPIAVLGVPPMGPRDHEVKRYLAAYGRTFGKASRPAKHEMGEPNECYQNASQLLIHRDDLDYAEGYCYPVPGVDLPVLHGWCVTKDGDIVDPTPTVNPAKARYFGVVYERKAYMKSMFKQKFYGMLGADYKTADLVVQTGAKGIRKEK